MQKKEREQLTPDLENLRIMKIEMEAGTLLKFQIDFSAVRFQAYFLLLKAWGLFLTNANQPQPLCF